MTTMTTRRRRRRHGDGGQGEGGGRSAYFFSPGPNPLGSLKLAARGCRAWPKLLNVMPPIHTCLIAEGHGVGTEEGERGSGRCQVSETGDGWAGERRSGLGERHVPQNVKTHAPLRATKKSLREVALIRSRSHMTRKRQCLWPETPQAVPLAAV